VNQQRIWLTGKTRSGKTGYLAEQFSAWVQQRSSAANSPFSTAAPEMLGVLALAAIGDNRFELVDRLSTATQGKYPVYSTTPLGFFQDEVLLFYPLLVQQLDLPAPFPLRLAPENEQELATRLWRSHLDQAVVQASENPTQARVTESRLVRRVLDLMQLAALAGMTIAEIPTMLEDGGLERELPIASATVGEMLQAWRSWCLERGLLTYAMIAELYEQSLLPHRTYREHLARRFWLLLADDVNEYPAIARHLFEVLLDRGCDAVFTFNPDGAVRLGLGADPDYLVALADRCQVESLDHATSISLAETLGETIVQLVTDPLFFTSLPESVQAIQTVSRSQLLRRTAEIILEGIEAGEVQPSDVAVIAPGMDAIARYSLTEILSKNQILVESLHDQRPLNSSPTIRALLTLLTLVYSGLGWLVDQNSVAEMLVVLSRSFATTPTNQIDPVRAGLLADYCFVPHPDRPRLLPATTFPRWDRLGYQASAAYQELVQWIDGQRSQLEQRLIPNAVVLLDRAMQQFLLSDGNLPYDQLAALRQLMETAQHYWEVHNRLRRTDRSEPPSTIVGRFIQLLRSGTVTANPFPVRAIGTAANAVTLANVFQYRASRRAHRWQFWLDAGSPRWLSGVDALFGAPLFLQAWSGQAWTAADTLEWNDRRLQRILQDLLGRTEARVYLCYSDLATSGQEQTGVLLSLVNAAVPINL
jgi:hypothetical protein